MKVLQFVHEGLGNSSYLLDAGDGTAILVDPDRSVERYIEAAAARGLRIETVLETHLHADFVSGAHELLARAGARLLLPRRAASQLPHHTIDGGERVETDGVAIEAIASPGHTPEHLSYALRTASGPPMLFSGGSLIVGGAARTDLIAPDQTDDLSRAQYRTITRAFAGLPGNTLLYPTHGGGSFCSAGAGSERTSTLGAERRQNPLLAISDEEEFVRYFPTTFPAAPDYFFRMRTVNQRGARLRAEISMPPPLTPSQFRDAQGDALIVDTRNVDSYAGAHIPGSLHIPFRDSFAVWVGWLVPQDQPLLFVADEATLPRAIDECLLVGYERFAGSLAGGVESWTAGGLPIASTDVVDGRGAAALIAEGALPLDVREPDEFAAGHVAGAFPAPLGTLTKHDLGDLSERPLVVHCGAGERASTAVSILERSGVKDVHLVRGGARHVIDAMERAATP